MSWYGIMVVLVKMTVTLDMLGDDNVTGSTQGTSMVRSAAVLKNHARSYMKQARKSGMTLLQRLGMDAHFAYNCAVQDLTPKCIWITVLGNTVLPAIKRTREEIQSGRVRQYKARMCLVAQEPGTHDLTSKSGSLWHNFKPNDLSELALGRLPRL